MRSRAAIVYAAGKPRACSENGGLVGSEFSGALRAWSQGGGIRSCIIVARRRISSRSQSDGTTRTD